MKNRVHCPDSGARIEYAPVPDAKGMILICPGGGYWFVSPREGEPVANAFAKAGWQPFILTYTVDGETLGVKPLREAAWAVRAAREAGEGMGLSGKPLAMCGFSAGGHLAASLGVHWNDSALFPDAEERRKHRPEALILAYPVISDGPCRHAGSFERLAGKNGDTRYFSLEKHAGADTPPTFLWHTAADQAVPAANSLLFAESLIRSGVPVELHIYPYGTHGLSLATEEVAQPSERRLADPHVAGWLGQCLEWLEVVLPGGRQTCTT